MSKLSYRKATIHDLQAIIRLLVEDDLGKNREQLSDIIDSRYTEAFQRIDSDPNQYLMVVNCDNEIVGTCHLTIMPSLTFVGSTRMQIEAVRISKAHRGQKIGAWMMSTAVSFAKTNRVSMIQLTTNKQRPQAKQFYEHLGFEATHEGMKLYL